VTVSAVRGELKMQCVFYESKENIGIITLSREKALNALNVEMIAELKDIFKKIGQEKNIYAVIITGAGDKSFVAGADISEMKDLNPEEAYKFGKFGSSVFRDIENSRMPVIAAINGYALGGGLELALACDIRIASENAIFGFPEVGLGIIPGYGGTQRLPRIVGISQAKKMMYTAERINAGKALEIGLIDEITQKDNLMESTIGFASKIALQAPIAVTSVKAAVNKGINVDVDAAYIIETEIFAKCFDTQDQKNVMDAFLKKEKLAKFENK
jgi:enoyl-CoA hydratase